jgi:hypothetical protein
MSSSAPAAAPVAASPADTAVVAAGGSAVPAGAKYTKRKVFAHGGRTIYEWEQDIEQVDMWITPPPGVTAKMIACNITDRHLTLGIKGNPPFIDVSHESEQSAHREHGDQSFRCRATRALLARSFTLCAKPLPLHFAHAFVVCCRLLRRTQEDLHATVVVDESFWMIGQSRQHTLESVSTSQGSIAPKRAKSWHTDRR